MVKEVHSHAHEEGVPGTVNLRAVEGDDTYLGQALFPVPSNDPNDPLNWPKYKYYPHSRLSFDQIAICNLIVIAWQKLMIEKLRFWLFAPSTLSLEMPLFWDLRCISLSGLRSSRLTSGLLPV
jgi:hypothetical protein